MKNKYDAASQAGGEYLESIGVYDMSKMSVQQWNKFIDRIVDAVDFYDSIPF